MGSVSQAFGGAASPATVSNVGICREAETWPGRPQRLDYAKQLSHFHEAIASSPKAQARKTAFSLLLDSIRMRTNREPLLIRFLFQFSAGFLTMMFVFLE